MQLKWRGAILFSLVLFNLLILTFHDVSGQQLVVSQLTCEYRINPVGIDAFHPRFSWVIDSKDHDIKQTAYRIIVSDNMEQVKTGKGGVWDSGKMISGQSIQVQYKGPKLKASTKYFWCVRIWDNKGNASKWSAPAHWQMGLLTSSDWKNANWIAYDELPKSKLIIPAAHLGGKPEWGKLEDILPLLRKGFHVKKPIEQATIFISGLGHFELSVNGKKVGDHFLDPGWTLYTKHALYVGFDLTDQIRPGDNAIGVMLGNGFYHVPAERYRKITGTFGHPKMICRLVLRYRDGSIENVISDSTWKTTNGPVTFSSIYSGEDYDARLEQEGWNKAGFNDKSWKPAVVVDGPPTLDASMTEPLKVMQIFSDAKITEPRPGVYVYDFGQNFSGIPSISVEGERGKKIRIVPGEILDSSGLVSQQPSGGPTYFNYILKGDGIESWQPRFTYYGFRYLQIEGAVPHGGKNPDRQPVISKLDGLHTRHSARATGIFSCSNQLFNDIFRLIDWSVKSNLASVLTDCPHREKLGWLEVPHLLGNSVRYSYDIASLYRKIVVDMKMSQTENGFVPNIAPEWVRFDPDFRDSPEWGSSSVILPYNLYKWYGDKEVLRESYSMMKRYVDYLGTKANSHIVSHGLGDWFDIGPGGSGSGYSVSTPQGITGTAMYYYDLQILTEVAAILGNIDDANKYRQLGEEVNRAFNEKFFDRKTKQYGTGSQTANAMALHMNLVAPEDRKAVVENIKKDIRKKNNRLSSGEVGYKSLLAVLEAEGESDVIYDMNSRSDVPGYGYQIAHGATTLMEDWQAIKTLGNNHCMLGHLLGWLYSGLGGIRQDETSNAFRKIIISPEIVGDISWVKTKYQSPHGLITSEWKKDAGLLSMYVEIPANTEAVIYLPATENSQVDINGRKTKAGEMDKSANKKKIKINVGSGKYWLTVTDNSHNEKGTPDLIPLPQSVKWSEEVFDLSKCKGIVLQDTSLKKEAVHLQAALRSVGLSIDILPSDVSKDKSLFIGLAEVKAPHYQNEAYVLSVKNNGVVLTANTATGIFRGIQTLLQLMNNGFVKGCTIMDFPAFQWRGYMVDVGRNYQSPAQLKQQIDVMARYKLNIFHFHLTEDIAWRLQIKQYPQLTAAQTTLRNKGKFYSIEEMQDLIRYCNERHITLVPEIDIPGHSKAFERAMGVNMQSREGTIILKNIFEEICKTYDVPYLHIGADEVKITNPAFISDMSAVLRKYNKQIVAWAPGGNYDDGIIRQLWKEEGNKDISKRNIRYVDSKFLYISDFDPLSSVVTIFNRQLGEKAHGDSSLLGGEFCLWNDRKVTDEKDLLSKNPVYPSMLAFAERSWKGNGYPCVVFAIGSDGERRASDFGEFETRLLSHKQKYFNQLPFVYVKQTHINWKLFGPFDNKGNLSASFWPEKHEENAVDSMAALKAVGGTIWLWHTHGPKVKAWVPSPKENTTWYAYTRFWSNSDTVCHLWADFKDLSRSGADATPPKDQWDYMQSKLWINNSIIPPPEWKFPGRPSGRLEEPMIDETYYYRQPQAVNVRKGWNEVMLKLPMGRFDPNLDWQVPPKWMFTLVPVEKGPGINWEASELRFDPN